MSKVSVNLLCDERWPDVVIGRQGDGVVVEVEPATLARWRSVSAEYEAVQTEMLATMEAVREERKP